MAERELPPAAHETTDAAFRPVAIGLLLTGLALGSLAGFAYWLYPQAITDRTIAMPLPRYPEPQLQVDPATDMQAFLAREQQVLQSLFEGLTNKEIAAQLSVSESAVKATLQQLFQKTRVRTRSQLVRIALESSLGATRKL